MESRPSSPSDRGRPPIDRDAPADVRQAVVALGCFWGPDALFGALDGVVRTRVGYAGGATPDPTYDDIGDHIEAVRIEYDPEQIDYGTVLDHFWAAHEPTRAPFKRQYQSALFPCTEAQIEQARVSINATAERLDASLATEIIEDAPFYRAEAYHQKHALRRHDTLMQALRPRYPDETTFTDAPAAALLNGYAGGHRAPHRVADDQPRLDLPPKAADALRSLVEQRHS